MFRIEKPRRRALPNNAEIEAVFKIADHQGNEKKELSVSPGLDSAPT